MGIWLRLRCGIVSERIPKVKVTGVVKDCQGVEVRMLYFGDVAEKVVLENAEECLLRVDAIEGYNDAY